MSLVVSIISLSVGVIALLALLVAALVLQHRKKYPEKSYAIALLNVALSPLYMLQIGPYQLGKITLEKVMDLVSKDLKLTDYGNLSFVARYKTVTDMDTFKELQYTPLGYIAALSTLRYTMARRLMMVDYLKKCPEVLQVPLRAPIIVMGMGRSGTTYLHRLLALDPSHRSPTYWELMAPVPDSSKAFTGADPQFFEEDRAFRREFVRKDLEAYEGLGEDGFRNVHEVRCDYAEECLPGLACEMPFSLMYLPTMVKHWDELKEEGKITPEDITAAYAWHKKLLQLLSFQTNDLEGTKRWVLKCPRHLNMVKELAEVFPDAKLVWAHRHPQQTISSLCSLIVAMRSLYFDSDGLDRKKVGERMLTSAQKCVVRAPDDIAKSGLDCAHVLYEQLVSDPIGTVKKVYEELGLAFTPAYEQALLVYLEENKKQREEMKEKLSKNGGRKKETLHEHKVEDFGIAAHQLNEGVFADYMKRYGIKANI